MPQHWFVERGERREGPLTASQLKQLVSEGKLTPRDKIQKDGMSHFVPAGSVKGLFPVLDAPVRASLPLTSAVAEAPIVNLPIEPRPVEIAAQPAPQPTAVVAKGGLRLTPWLWIGGSAAAATIIVAVTISQFNGGGDSKKTATQVEWKPGLVITNSDDSRLWRAAATTDYLHNREKVSPERWPEHGEMVARFANGKTDDWKTKFATSVIAKDSCLEAQRKLVAKSQGLQLSLPGALGKSLSNTAIRTLAGREPSWHELLDEKIPGGGGLVETADALRINKVREFCMEIDRYSFDASIADQAEAKYRQALGGRALGEEFDLLIHGEDHQVQLSLAGKKPLMNVAIVVRAEMRSESGKAAATRNAIDGINETFDPGADRNRMAHLYLESARVMHESPQATFVYVPVLEPGDELVIRHYDVGFYWDAKKVTVSVYSDSGAILDKVTMVGGDHNNLDVPAQQRNKAEPSAEKPFAGPTFNRGLGSLEIQLKPTAARQFERCVEVASTYKPMGIQDPIESGAALKVVAKSDAFYVAVGPKKRVGYGLVLIPVDSVALANDPNPKVDSKKDETLKVESFKRATRIVLNDPRRGSKNHTFETASKMENGICTKTGKSVEFESPAGEIHRAVGTSGNLYVVFLDKPASDGSRIILVPKTSVKEVK